MKVTILSSIFVVFLNFIDLISSADRSPDIPPGFYPPQSPRVRPIDLNLSAAQLRYPAEGELATLDEFKIGSIDDTGERHAIWCDSPRRSRVKVHISGSSVVYITEEVFNQLMDAYFESRLDHDIKMPIGCKVTDKRGYIIAVIVDKKPTKIKRKGKTIDVHVSGRPWRMAPEKNFDRRVYSHTGPMVSRETMIDDVWYHLLDFNTGPPNCMKYKCCGVWYDAVKKESGLTYPTPVSDNASTSRRRQGRTSKRGKEQ